LGRSGLICSPRCAVVGENNVLQDAEWGGLASLTGGRDSWQWHFSATGCLTFSHLSSVLSAIRSFRMLATRATSCGLPPTTRRQAFGVGMLLRLLRFSARGFDAGDREMRARGRWFHCLLQVETEIQSANTAD
jgi:hypothetical protein